MKPNLTLLGGALLLAACSNTSAIQEAVKENLLDPDSAKFGDIIEYTSDDGDKRACVEVNAKNRMGGYVGDKVFLAMQTESGGWAAMSLDRDNRMQGMTCSWFMDNIVNKVGQTASE